MIDGITSPMPAIVTQFEVPTAVVTITSYPCINIASTACFMMSEQNGNLQGRGLRARQAGSVRFGLLLQLVFLATRQE